MGTLRDPSTINNVGILGGATNPTTAQALPLERENQKAIRELVGTFGYEDLTISSGGITPTKAEVTVDTEAGASADDLTTIYLVSDGTTTLHDGMLLKLRAYDPARIVTVKHGSGTNQIQTISGTDIVLGTTWELTLKLQSGVWKEVQGKPVIDITGNAATATLATTATTATTAQTLKQGGIIAPTSGGTSTEYTVASSPVVSAYAAGNVYQFVAHAACGNAPTVNFDGLGAKSIKRFSGGAKVVVTARGIPAGSLVACLYDGTDMVIAGDALLGAYTRLNIRGTSMQSLTKSILATVLTSATPYGTLGATKSGDALALVVPVDGNYAITAQGCFQPVSAGIYSCFLAFYKNGVEMETTLSTCGGTSIICPGTVYCGYTGPLVAGDDISLRVELGANGVVYTAYGFLTLTKVG